MDTYIRRMKGLTVRSRWGQDRRPGPVGEVGCGGWEKEGRECRRSCQGQGLAEKLQDPFASSFPQSFLPPLDTHWVPPRSWDTNTFGLAIRMTASTLVMVMLTVYFHTLCPCCYKLAIVLGSKRNTQWEEIGLMTYVWKFLVYAKGHISIKQTPLTTE